MRLSVAALDFADRLCEAPDLASCWEALNDAYSQFGIVSALYGFIPHTHPTCPDGKLPIVLSSHPDDFMARYDEADHMDHDPAVMLCLTDTKPFRWYDPSYMENLTPRQMQVEKEAMDFGLRNGLGIPLRDGSPLDKGGFGLNAGDMPDREFEAMVQHHFEDILCIANVFHEAVVSRTLAREMISLSGRETECLHWAAKGQRVAEIAETLGIGVDAVNQYLGRTRKKLKACNTTQAVARALTLGILHM